MELSASCACSSDKRPDGIGAVGPGGSRRSVVAPSGASRAALWGAWIRGPHTHSCTPSKLKLTFADLSPADRQRWLTPVIAPRPSPDSRTAADGSAVSSRTAYVYTGLGDAERTLLKRMRLE